MTDVLIVEDDASFAAPLARSLEAARYRVAVAASYEQAMDRLASTRFDVLLTDLRLSDRDGIDLLASVRALPRAPRAILMSGYASARDHQTATELGAVRVLCKPFGPDELLGAVRQAVECEDGFHASVHGLSLVDLLQMLHLAQRTVTLRVGGDTPAEIHLDAGEVVHATRGPVTGAAAFAGALSTRAGWASTSVLDPAVPRTISASFDALLLDALRAADEERRDSADAIEVDGILDGIDFSELEDVAAEPAAPRAGRARRSVWPPGATPEFELEARTLWARAAVEVREAVELATVVALGAAAETTVRLQGGLSPEALATAARAALLAADALASGRCLSIEAHGPSAVLSVHRAAGSAFALAVVDEAPDASGAIWLRSALATIGRFVHGAERAPKS